MEPIFTIGNLITLGISFLVIFVLRYLDRHNRSVDLAREFGKRLKDDIAGFAEAKAFEVKDNGLILDVQKSAVKEALNRLSEANTELTEKTAAILQRLQDVSIIGERISAYDKSMEELIRMTGKVEDNMNRLKGESASMDAAAKKIAAIKTRTEELEHHIETLERRFEEENTAALEKAVKTVISQVDNSMEELETAARAVDRQLEEHRLAVDRIEEDRKVSLDRDREIITNALGEALDQAETRASKLEEDALAKYREEAMQRINQFQHTIEEKFREYHENAKTRVAEIQTMVKSYRDEWKTDHAQMEIEHKEYRETWQRDIDALDALALSQREQWEGSVEETKNRLSRLGQEIGVRTAELEERMLKEMEDRLSEYKLDQSTQWKRFEELAEDALKLDSQLRMAMKTAEEKMYKDLAVFEEAQKNKQDSAGAALEENANALKVQIEELEQEFTVLKKRAYDNVEEKLQVFEDEFFADLAKRSTDIDGRLSEWHSALERKLSVLAEKTEIEQQNLELSFKEEMNARIEEQSERLLNELERIKTKTEVFEEKINNGLDQTESRISGLNSSAEEIRLGIKEFSSHTRLFEKADELKTNLERSMEDLKLSLSGIEEKRAEAARLETEFIKIRRLEDEVNNKMTRFLTEKNHLDIMERDFDRLIQTAQRVEERLKEVTGADDTLQHIQVSLRKMEDAIAAAEDKYQRVENKNRILEETNRGIERNFEIMEETELALRKCRENIDRLDEEMDSFRPSIENLAAASVRALETGEKLGILDSGLAAIENRIEKMQVAREWLAKAETRFEELNKEAGEKLKLLEAILKNEGKKSGSSDGAPPARERENVIKLARQGWGPDEIARAVKISRGEVELILELGVKN